jgi:hypothetical protein
MNIKQCYYLLYHDSKEDIIKCSVPTCEVCVAGSKNSKHYVFKTEYKNEHYWFHKYSTLKGEKFIKIDRFYQEHKRTMEEVENG